MTGRGNGVTGILMESNPALINVHCIAHRLALCTSQAANQVSYLKEYQETVTSIFYYFKHSSVRVEKMKEIQNLLEDPVLRYTEVHDVRWLSFYKAIETIYRTMTSLITFFGQEKNPKGIGLSKRIEKYEFVACTYLMMAVLPIVTALSMIFQKKDLDVTVVDVGVKNCLSDLDKLKAGDTENTYLKQLETDFVKKGKGYDLKGTYIPGHPNCEKHFTNIVNNFVGKLQENIQTRFPQDQRSVMSAFSVLGMRPISFLSSEELSVWGNDKLQTLIDHFGKELSHKESTSVPLLDPAAAKAEWSQIKPLVVDAAYPRDKLSTLWSIIHTYHKDMFPNLLKLAAVALVLPVHTADCERGFSNQNYLKTARRNRLSATRLQSLLTILTEGPAINEFDFQAATNLWKTAKSRRLFNPAFQSGKISGESCV